MTRSALSIYSPRDGVVDRRACVDPAGENLEVGSHLAMASDATTLRAVAAALGPPADEAR